MNVTKEIQKIENSALKLTATIAQADVESGYKSEFAKYAKNIQIPGFRKGHVPPNCSMTHIHADKAGARIMELDMVF